MYAVLGNVVEATAPCKEADGAGDRVPVFWASCGRRDASSTEHWCARRTWRLSRLSWLRPWTTMPESRVTRLG